MFYYTTFLKHHLFPYGSHVYVGGIQNKTFNFGMESLEEKNGGEETPFLDFVASMKLKSLCPNKWCKLAHNRSEANILFKKKLS